MPGIATVLFFQCMDPFLNPVDRTKRGIKRGLLAAYTIAHLSVVIVNGAMSIHLLSISYYADDREFPGNDVYPPGPSGYQAFIYSKAIGTVPDVMSYLSTYLANGFFVSTLLEWATLVTYPSNFCSYIVAT